MRAGHDIACLRIAARNVGENVVGVMIRVLEVHAAVDFELHIALLGEACEPPVVLGAEFHARQFGCLADPITVAFAMHQPAFDAGHLHPGDRSLLRQEIIQLGSEAKTVDSFLPCLRIEGRLLVPVQLCDFRLGQALEGRVGIVFGRPRPGDQYDLPRQLTLPVGEILVADHGCNDHRGVERAVGGRRPRNGNTAQFERPGHRHAHVRRFNPPSSPEVESFGPDVLQSPALELILGPALGPAHGGRIGHPAADLVGQIRGDVDHLAMIESRIGNAVDGGDIRRRGRCKRRHRQQRTGSQASH